MNGIINVIKPPGMSSHQVVKAVRQLLGIKRVGHTGTLDPGAGGVLPLCVGKATRLASFLFEEDKSYTAELTLGISTTTQDASGDTIRLSTDFHITPIQFADTLALFLGEIEQIPPMASAVRVDGKRLYELERKGITVERKPRKVQIKTLNIRKIWNEYPEFLTFGTRVLLHIECSKGTYVRTLCHDIGERLGVGAHMSFLSRTSSGPFTLEDGYTLQEIEEFSAQQDYRFLLPIQTALPSWPQVKVSPLVERRVRHGNYILPEDLVDVPTALSIGDDVILLSVEGEVLALAEIRKTDQLICQPFMVFMEG
jgi:tRNA pseudouridine55 synthase